MYQVLSDEAEEFRGYSYRVASAILDALPEATPRCPFGTFCAMYGRAQCITTTRFDGHHPTDKIQRVSGPPGGPEIRQQHRRRSQRRNWGQELTPSRPQPPTGGTAGITPATGSPTIPGVCRPAHARAGWWCWVWCTGVRVIFSGGARASGERRPTHRAGERN
jgi:hypothetical protein